VIDDASALITCTPLDGPEFDGPEFGGPEAQAVKPNAIATAKNKGKIATFRFIGTSFPMKDKSLFLDIRKIRLAKAAFSDQVRAGLGGTIGILHAPHLERWPSEKKPRLSGLVRKFLAADAGFVHQAAFGDRENRHSLVIGPHGCRIVAAAAGTRGTASSARRSRCPCRNRDGRRLCAEFEVGGRELVERALVLEEDDLAVSLTTQLSPDRGLVHRGVTDMFVTGVDSAMAGRNNQ
jgi:hypothetical protein